MGDYCISSNISTEEGAFSEPKAEAVEVESEASRILVQQCPMATGIEENTSTFPTQSDEPSFFLVNTATSLES
jgi:hypothetical protein